MVGGQWRECSVGREQPRLDDFTNWEEVMERNETKSGALYRERNRTNQRVSKAGRLRSELLFGRHGEISVRGGVLVVR